MANLVCKRVSTDQQSTARQNLVLDEGIEDPIPFEEKAGTSIRSNVRSSPRTGELLSTVKFMVQPLAAPANSSATSGGN